MSNFRLHHGDAVGWLRTLPDASVDLVITDPPYESLEKHRAVGTTTRLKHSKASSNDWFEIFPNARFGELFAEVHRVLRRNTHFYLFCDPETAFIAKPIAEQAGFKFWKPLVWDKCIAPETPIWTARGVVTAGEVTPEDLVCTPRGVLVPVLATRRTRSAALRIELSDGTHIIASREHRFLRAGRRETEAGDLVAGDALASERVEHGPTIDAMPLDQLVDEDDRIVELPSTTRCLFCGRAFESSRAAAAHQARWCAHARSKRDMAADLCGEDGAVTAKRLRRWMNQGRLPLRWARALGLEMLATDRVQARLQNDVEQWFPSTIRLDYAWGKLVGLFAAEGWSSESSVTFALHKDEKHLQNHIARLARSLGCRATVKPRTENGCTVEVHSKLFARLIREFVGGERASTKFLRPIVYAGPDAFRDGVFDGLMEGDGHWSHDEQRETVVSASLDLAMFVQRHARERGWHSTIRRFENDHLGGYRIRFDPQRPTEPVSIVSITPEPEQELVDLAIDDPSQLFLLGNGLVTHNCKIGMGYHYRARYEFILFFEKGKRKLNDLGIADIIEAPRIHHGYPAEKPVEVSEVLVRQSTEPGERVIDPFMGSGSVGVAAVRNGRDFAGNDLCAESLAVTAERLRAAGAIEAAAPGPARVNEQLALGVVGGRS